MVGLSNTSSLHIAKLVSKIFASIEGVSFTNHAHVMCAIKGTSKFTSMTLGMYITNITIKVSTLTLLNQPM